jgi:D-alanyl-D-alanine carboxypeptidase (penicillin-binding protein 5/6)
MENYVAYANELAKELGLENSYFGDASGWSPTTVGTAEDLVKLGDKAMQNPVFAEIVSKWTVTHPEAGELFSTNVFLDYEGNNVVGIKTGYTEQAGGTYLAAARYQLEDNQEVTVLAAVLTAPSHFQGQQDTMPLLTATRDNFHIKPVLKEGQSLGAYDVPWGDTVTAVVASDVVAPVWGDKVLLPHVQLESIKAPLGSSAQVGAITTDTTTSVPVNLEGSVNPPPIGWRLFYGLKQLLPN